MKALSGPLARRCVSRREGRRARPGSTYDEARHRLPAKRALGDAEILTLIAEARDHRFRVRFGARKMWLHLRAQGRDVARCTVERLMAQQGWAGALRGMTRRTTIPAPNDPRPADLVDRDFTATAPHQFVFDVFSRKIIGWRAATTMTTELVLDTLEMAIWSRAREGAEDLAGLVHQAKGPRFRPRSCPAAAINLRPPFGGATLMSGWPQRTLSAAIPPPNGRRS